MKKDRPSLTAQRVALARAAHQIVDPAPRVLEDPLAARILGGEPAVRQHLRHHTPFARRMRAFVVARSRFAEDELAAAVARGAHQYVLLGAGLDTFAWRNAAAVRVFEVDHPSTQAMKRRFVADAGLDPQRATFVAVDFARESWLQRLEAAGFRRDVPTHFAWLGVTMYLSREEIAQTLAMIAALPAPASLVLDYLVPAAELGPAVRIAFQVLSGLVAFAGEPLKSQFSAGEMQSLLASHGFLKIEDLSPDALNARFFAGRADGLSVGTMGRIVSAAN